MKFAFRIAHGRVADAIIIVLIGSLLYVLWQVWGTDRQHDQNLQLGSQLKLSGVEWAESEATLLLTLSVNCSTCTNELPFYRRLISVARANRVPVLTVFSQSRAAATKWLRSRGITPDGVYSGNLRHLGFMIVPTILLLDNKGTVTHLWPGAISFRDQHSLLRIIQGKSPLSPKTADGLDIPPVISGVEFSSFFNRHKDELLVVDIRDRDLHSLGHWPGSINIPVDELDARGPIDLDHFKIIVVDCFNVPYALCALTASRLTSFRFDRVMILHREAGGPTPCRTCPE